MVRTPTPSSGYCNRLVLASSTTGTVTALGFAFGGGANILIPFDPTAAAGMNSSSPLCRQTSHPASGAVLNAAGRWSLCVWPFDHPEC